ncbi:MAG TPA: acetyl/propionyl/methylcrotonyl-CoA carboxylase subunit alpha [Ktedonobacteraceae bacterium]|nr:acetyl/propionyl/methylcrotonyl-CoA carboxylase subunit alpha [Ktedonobacteraceae bacterium]
MLKKILIANRGEIAVRIMATCREMGIQTVAVYSDGDQQARHVYAADEAYAIGPAPADQSYLRGDKIIAIAQQSGAEAIHPGYGFLAENADFAEACEQTGLVFIGPPASAMRLMGSKIAAKQLALSVGAPIVPGYNGERQDDATLLDEAARVGFPLLIKASAGGGGKGMRVVNTPDSFVEQLAGARREAKAAFGDDTVFLERLILQPRHIEIQVLGDRHGHLIYLGERECSIQRRHQKIIEESPSVALTPELRAEMGAVAVRIAQAAGYVNAGTLEFMLDADNQYYFLEMNTRLQVEHPVTELVTGLDLVRHQLLIASGQPLQIAQEQVVSRGHAIEARIYAEDPAHDYLPSTGTITRFTQPAGPGIRLDSGVIQGDEINPYYDPLIAKLIVFGEERTIAIDRLHRALEQCTIFGVTTNVALLDAISMHPAFVAGDTHTSFLEEHPQLTQTATRSTGIPPAILVAAALSETRQAATQYSEITASPERPSTPPNPWRTLGPWRMVGTTQTATYHWRDEEYKIALQQAAEQNNTWHVQVNGKTIGTYTWIGSARGEVLLQHEHKQFPMYVELQPTHVLVAAQGESYRLRKVHLLDVESAASGTQGAPLQKVISAPMAGTLIKVQVSAGDDVEAQQVLAILSAMKMEHAITAPYAGKVQKVHYQEGAVIAGGAAIVEMA